MAPLERAGALWGNPVLAPSLTGGRFAGDDAVYRSQLAKRGEQLKAAMSAVPGSNFAPAPTSAAPALNPLTFALQQLGDALSIGLVTGQTVEIAAALPLAVSKLQDSGELLDAHQKIEALLTEIQPIVAAAPNPPTKASLQMAAIERSLERALELAERQKQLSLVIPQGRRAGLEATLRAQAGDRGPVVPPVEYRQQQGANIAAAAAAGVAGQQQGANPQAAAEQAYQEALRRVRRAPVEPQRHERIDIRRANRPNGLERNRQNDVPRGRANRQAEIAARRGRPQADNVNDFAPAGVAAAQGAAVAAAAAVAGPAINPGNRAARAAQREAAQREAIQTELARIQAQANAHAEGVARNVAEAGVAERNRLEAAAVAAVEQQMRINAEAALVRANQLEQQAAAAVRQADERVAAAAAAAERAVAEAQYRANQAAAERTAAAERVASEAARQAVQAQQRAEAAENQLRVAEAAHEARVEQEEAAEAEAAAARAAVPAAVNAQAAAVPQAAAQSAAQAAAAAALPPVNIAMFPDVDQASRARNYEQSLRDSQGRRPFNLADHRREAREPVTKRDVGKQANAQRNVKMQDRGRTLREGKVAERRAAAPTTKERLVWRRGDPPAAAPAAQPARAVSAADAADAADLQRDRQQRQENLQGISDAMQTMGMVRPGSAEHKRAQQTIDYFQTRLRIAAKGRAGESARADIAHLAVLENILFPSTDVPAPDDHDTMEFNEDDW